MIAKIIAGLMIVTLAVYLLAAIAGGVWLISTIIKA